MALITPLTEFMLHNYPSPCYCSHLRGMANACHDCFQLKKGFDNRNETQRGVHVNTHTDGRTQRWMDIDAETLFFDVQKQIWF